MHYQYSLLGYTGLYCCAGFLDEGGLALQLQIYHKHIVHVCRFKSRWLLVRRARKSPMEICHITTQSNIQEMQACAKTHTADYNRDMPPTDCNQHGSKPKWAVHAAGEYRKKIWAHWGQLHKFLCEWSIPVNIQIKVNSHIRKQVKLGHSVCITVADFLFNVGIKTTKYLHAEGVKPCRAWELIFVLKGEPKWWSKKQPTTDCVWCWPISLCLHLFISPLLFFSPVVL